MIFLIIPCYNEEQRLDISAFVESGLTDAQYFFVDDGSKDNTVSLIKSWADKVPNVHLVKLHQNSGKAEAVRQGMMHVQTHHNPANSDWIGFWDADLATPLNEIPKMLQYAEMYSGPVESIWCSRIYRLGSEIKRSLLRHYLGRGFATLIGELLKVKSYDSQCGAKLFRPQIVTKAFSEPFISKWIFDVEILLRLNDKAVIEYPVTKWSDIPGSKVKISREIFRVFFEILKIRKKYQIR